MSGELDVLRRFGRRRTTAEQCDFCGRMVTNDHQHLIEPATRRVICVCDACAILFPGGHARYRRVPRRCRLLADFQLTNAQWDGLLIPIELAFFYTSSHAGRTIALYPSPAGPTESLLPLDVWEEIVHANSAMARIEPDVEALVVNRLATPAEYYVLPIDECFRLVGLIRVHWKGLSGGTAVWNEISQFFSALRVRTIQPHEVIGG